MSNINYTQKNTKKELLNILSNLKKTEIVDMINQYNTNQNKLIKVKNNNNYEQLNYKIIKKNQTKNTNKTKNKIKNKIKNKNNKSSIEVVKKIIHIPQELNKIEFKKSRANNIEYKNI